ncbi:MAG: 16S rRNA (guanine(966)-N(2))-methyltransferase RsmD [Clostridia bacterium]|nr:16S rRNA (guanine(966)-N(2))-methyltransferase RsmD [Clostridia bacterium]
MRVISGKYKGRKLFSPSDDNVRPTTDRIKETVFNILAFQIDGARVLDLFAGSGALGIECISRGASAVVIADKAQTSLDLVRKNLKGIDGKYSVLFGDYLKVLGGIKGQFDLIFIDPPYDGNMGETAVNYIIEHNILAPNGTIYFEHSKEKEFVAPSGYKTRTKPMGYTVAEFIKKKTVCMLTGSFDPITIGHEALIDFATAKYDEVIIACLVNPDKEYMFTPDERLSIVNAAIVGRNNVRAIYAEGLAVDVAKAQGADILLRGVRNETDEKYEQEMKAYNLNLGVDTDIVTLDILNNVSSTLVREQLKNNDFSLLPKGAVETVKNILKTKK